MAGGPRSNYIPLRSPIGKRFPSAYRRSTSLKEGHFPHDAILALIHTIKVPSGAMNADTAVE